MDLNRSNRDGFTPLTHAIEQQRHDIVLALLDKKVDLQMPDKLAHLPLELATQIDNIEILKDLFASFHARYVENRIELNQS
jgi:ankyrin repeat protein